MVANITTSVIQRKIAMAANRRAHAALHGALVSDLELYSSKAFLTLLQCEAKASVTNSSILSKNNVNAALSGPLYGILNLNGGTGLVAFDENFIDAVITGLVSDIAENPPVQSRPVSATDATLVRHLLNTILKDVFFQGGEQDTVAATDFGMVDHSTQKAPLIYLLTEQKYALLSIRIQNATRDLGGFDMIAPISCINAFAAPDALHTTEVVQKNWQNHMNDVAVTTKIEMRAVLQHMPIALRELLNLKAGELLSIPNGTMANLSLEAPTAGKPLLLCKGQLGALSINKAFKVKQVIAPQPEGEVAEILPQ